MSTKFSELLAFHASCALVGLKSSNLISISLDDVPDLFEQIDEFKSKLGHKLSLYVFKIKDNRALVLVYRESKLKEALFERKRYKYLLSHGFPKEKSICLYLDCLKEKLNGDVFPDEIGIFLGYDLYDTIQFERKNKNCLYVGYWKVFKDKEEKIKLFNKYTKCRDIVYSLVGKGYSLERLIA